MASNAFTLSLGSMMDWGKVFQAANARGMKLYFSTLVREDGWVRCFIRVHMSRLTYWRGKKKQDCNVLIKKRVSYKFVQY